MSYDDEDEIASYCRLQSITIIRNKKKILIRLNAWLGKCFQIKALQIASV